MKRLTNQTAYENRGIRCWFCDVEHPEGHIVEFVMPAVPRVGEQVDWQMPRLQRPAGVSPAACWSGTVKSVTWLIPPDYRPDAIAILEIELAPATTGRFWAGDTEPAQVQKARLVRSEE